MQPGGTNLHETGTDGRRPTLPLLLSRRTNVVRIMRLHEAQSVAFAGDKNVIKN
jgi:hypothetical protein